MGTIEADRVLRPPLVPPPHRRRDRERARRRVRRNRRIVAGAFGLVLLAVALLLFTRPAAHGGSPPPLPVATGPNVGPSAIEEGPAGRVALRRWVLHVDPRDAGLGHGLQSGDFAGRTVTVPNVVNPWPVSGPAVDANYNGSVAWYRTSFEVPSAGLYALHFESVNFLATTWVDGRRLGTHAGEYLPFEYRLRLGPGAHAVVVRVDWRNPAAQSVAGFHRTWFNFGGINREVSVRPIGASEVGSPSAPDHPHAAGRWPANRGHHARRAGAQRRSRAGHRPRRDAVARRQHDPHRLPAAAPRPRTAGNDDDPGGDRRPGPVGPREPEPLLTRRLDRRRERLSRQRRAAPTDLGERTAVSQRPAPPTPRRVARGGRARPRGRADAGGRECDRLRAAGDPRQRDALAASARSRPARAPRRRRHPRLAGRRSGRLVGQLDLHHAHPHAPRAAPGADQRAPGAAAPVDHRLEPRQRDRRERASGRPGRSTSSARPHGCAPTTRAASSPSTSGASTRRPSPARSTAVSMRSA